MTRWLRIANKTAQQGKHHSHRVGAVVVRGGKVLASAYNISRPFGRDNGGRHAEERALNNLDGRDFSGATLYVTRYGRTMSRPCPQCMEAIVRANIKKVVYLDWSGRVCVYDVKKGLDLVYEIE